MDSSVHCRKNAALFDVAHMCGASLRVRNLSTGLSKSRLLRSRQWTLRKTSNLAVICAVLYSQLEVLLQGKDAIEFLETLVVGDIASLKDRTGTLSVFTNEQGGIKDDSVITKVRVAAFLS